MIRIVISNAIYLSIPSSQNQWMSKVGNPSRDPFLENLGTIVFVHNLGTWLILPSKIPGGSSKWRFQSCQPWISEKLSVKKNRPSNDGATADHSQKHRHFAICLVSKPQDHSGNNHKPRISQNQNGFFRLSTNSFSSDGSSMQFSGAGLVRQVIPRERFPHLQPARNQRQNDKIMALHSPDTPGLLALDLAGGDIAAGPHLAMKGGSCSTLKLQWSSDLLINPINIPYPSISHLRFFAIPSAEELPSLALRRRWPSLWVIVAGVPPAGAKSAWRTRRTSCGPR